jgi:hypothetical protein
VTLRDTINSNTKPPEPCLNKKKICTIELLSKYSGKNSIPDVGAPISSCSSSSVALHLPPSNSSSFYSKMMLSSEEDVRELLHMYVLHWQVRASLLSSSAQLLASPCVTFRLLSCLPVPLIVASSLGIYQ